MIDIDKLEVLCTDIFDKVDTSETIAWKIENFYILAYVRY